ncbi:SPJ_0845 family protein [Vagococcus entomophilus]|nr:SPJ_0845 family protein [Vagococcus entomophilus]
MGLTFKRQDSLDEMFDKFAIDPDKKEKVEESSNDKEKNKKETKK